MMVSASHSTRAIGNRLVLVLLATFTVGCSTPTPPIPFAAKNTDDLSSAVGTQTVRADTVVYKLGNHATGVKNGRTAVEIVPHIFVQGKARAGKARQAIITFLPKLTGENVPQYGEIDGIGIIRMTMPSSQFASAVTLLSQPGAVVTYNDSLAVKAEIVVEQESR